MLGYQRLPGKHLCSCGPLKDRNIMLVDFDGDLCAIFGKPGCIQTWRKPRENQRSTFPKLITTHKSLFEYTLFLRHLFSGQPKVNPRAEAGTLTVRSHPDAWKSMGNIGNTYQAQNIIIESVVRTKTADMVSGIGKIVSSSLFSSLPSQIP